MQCLVCLGNFLVCLFLWVTAANGGCPNPHKLHPCRCLKGTAVVTCDEITSEDQLKSAMEASVEHKIVGVLLEYVTLQYIPSDAFTGNKIEFLEITNSSIMSLSEDDYAFKGAESSLKSLKVSKSTFVNNWDWMQLSNLSRLEELKVTETEVLDISKNFGDLALPIKELTFRDTSLFWIPDNAFQNLVNLTKIILEQNFLTSVKRSQFPQPAKTLQSLGFSHNNIKNLPSDLFSDMPVLRYLFLGANPIHILDENTFKPVWKQISMFVFHDTPLVCDCRLKWFTKIKSGFKFIHAFCNLPQRLKGKKITELEKDQLWC